MTDFIKSGVKVAVVAAAGVAVFAAGFVAGSISAVEKVSSLENENCKLRNAFKEANKGFKKVVRDLKDIVSDIDDDDDNGVEGAFEDVCACGDPFAMGSCDCE